MTAFATADDAAGFGYALPDAAAGGLLARATQMLKDAAAFDILSASATVRLRAQCGRVSLADVPLVTAVTALELVNEDGTTESVTDYTAPAEAGVIPRVCLGSTVPSRHCGLFAVTLTQGLASVPDSLVMLTSAVAYRLAAMPAGMSAGFSSQSVGSVSWSASSPPSDGELTAGELRRLGGIVPVRIIWPVML